MLINQSERGEKYLHLLIHSTKMSTTARPKPEARKPISVLQMGNEQRRMYHYQPPSQVHEQESAYRKQGQDLIPHTPIWPADMLSDGLIHYVKMPNPKHFSEM